MCTTPRRALPCVFFEATEELILLFFCCCVRFNFTIIFVSRSIFTDGEAFCDVPNRRRYCSLCRKYYTESVLVLHLRTNTSRPTMDLDITHQTMSKEKRKRKRIKAQNKIVISSRTTKFFYKLGSPPSCRQWAPEPTGTVRQLMDTRCQQQPHSLMDTQCRQPHSLTDTRRRQQPRPPGLMNKRRNDKEKLLFVDVVCS